MTFISDLKNIDQQYVRNSTQLNLALDIQGHGKLKCTQALRSIPGKRLTCLGHLNTKKVVVKFFYGSPWSRSKWSRCHTNARTLHSNAIATPDILYSEKIKHNFFVIIFEFVENAARIDMELQSRSSKKGKNHITSLLIKNIADQHGKGIFQKDLHLGNFLLKDDIIYSIDTDKVNLSRFFRHFKRYSLFSLSNLILNIMKYEKNVLDFSLESYCTSRNWRKRPEYKKIIARKIQHERKKDVKKFSRKVYKNRDPFRATKENGFFCVYNMRHLDHDCSFSKKSNINKSFKSVAKEFCSQKSCICYVNTFNILNLFFKKDPLFKAWKYNAILNRVGIITPIQLLYLRQKITSNDYKSLIVTKPVHGISLNLFMESKNYSQDQKKEIDNRIQSMILELKNFDFKLDRMNPKDWIINYPDIIFNYMKQVKGVNHSVHELKPENLNDLF